MKHYWHKIRLTHLNRKNIVKLIPVITLFLFISCTSNITKVLLNAEYEKVSKKSTIKHIHNDNLEIITLKETFENISIYKEYYFENKVLKRLVITPETCEDLKEMDKMLLNNNYTETKTHLFNNKQVYSIKTIDYTDNYFLCPHISFSFFFSLEEYNKTKEHIKWQSSFIEKHPECEYGGQCQSIVGLGVIDSPQ